MGIEGIKDEIMESFEGKQINNSDLVQIIELCGAYLNLKTIPDYAKFHGLTYNGAKRFRENVTLFNTKFIIDND